MFRLAFIRGRPHFVPEVASRNYILRLQVEEIHILDVYIVTQLLGNPDTRLSRSANDYYR